MLCRNLLIRLCLTYDVISSWHGFCLRPLWAAATQYIGKRNVPRNMSPEGGTWVMWLFRTQLSGRAHQPIRAGAEQTGLLPLSRLFWWLASRASVVRRRVPTMAFQKGVVRDSGMTASGMWLDSGTPTRVPHSFQSQLVGDYYCALGKVLCTFGPHLWPCVSPLHTWCAPSLLVAPPAWAGQSPRPASPLGGYECGGCVSDWINPPLPIRDFRALQCALFKQQTARRSAQECVASK